MRIIFTSLIFMLVTLRSFGQADSISSKETVNDSLSRLITEFKKLNLPHFTFKDIPIDGPLDQFVAKLKRQGFLVMETTDVDAILSGKFTGQDVRILVQSSTKVVYGVTVIYNEQTSWKSVKNQYDNVKSILTKKYGEPMETIEKFDSPDYQELDLELIALSEDKCTFMTLFTTKEGNGMIRLKISSDANLVINYVDSLNYLLVSDEAYKDY